MASTFPGASTVPVLPVAAALSAAFVAELSAAFVPRVGGLGEKREDQPPCSKPPGPLSFHGCSVSLACPSLPPFSSACPSHISCVSRHLLQHEPTLRPKRSEGDGIDFSRCVHGAGAAGPSGPFCRFCRRALRSLCPSWLAAGIPVQATVQAPRDAGRGLDEQGEVVGPRKCPAASSFPSRRRGVQLFAQLVDHLRARHSDPPWRIGRKVPDQGSEPGARGSFQCLRGLCFVLCGGWMEAAASVCLPRLFAVLEDEVGVPPPR